MAPAFNSVRFAAYIGKHPELIHIRTRRKSSGQNGVRERAFGSLRYEHLDRHEIDDGHTLGTEVETYRQLFNQIPGQRAGNGDVEPWRRLSKNAFISGGQSQAFSL